MVVNPLVKLFYSRKFLVLLLDSVVSVILHFAGGPDVQFLIGVLQPVALALIMAIAWEDAAEKRAGKV